MLAGDGLSLQIESTMTKPWLVPNTRTLDPLCQYHVKNRKFKWIILSFIGQSITSYNVLKTTDSCLLTVYQLSSQWMFFIWHKHGIVLTCTLLSILFTTNPCLLLRQRGDKQTRGYSPVASGVTILLTLWATHVLWLNIV